MRWVVELVCRTRCPANFRWKRFNFINQDEAFSPLCDIDALQSADLSELQQQVKKMKDNSNEIQITLRYYGILLLPILGCLLFLRCSAGMVPFRLFLKKSTPRICFHPKKISEGNFLSRSFPQRRWHRDWAVLPKSSVWIQWDLTPQSLLFQVQSIRSLSVEIGPRRLFASSQIDTRDVMRLILLGTEPWSPFPAKLRARNSAVHTNAVLLTCNINVLAEYYLKIQSGLFQGYAENTFPGHLSGNRDYMGYSRPEIFLLSGHQVCQKSKWQKRGIAVAGGSTA